MKHQPTVSALQATSIKQKVSLLMMLIIASAMTLLLLAGCSSPKPGSPQALAVEKEATEKKIDKNLKAMPEWYAKTPLDNNILFASATETSRNMQMSMEKASIKARAELALTVGGRVSTMMKAYAEEAGVSNDPDVNQIVSTVTSQEAINVNLSGVQRADAQINREGDSYRAYVLIRYPLGELNKIAVEQVRQSTVLNAKFRASKAFEDLERKVEEAKKREAN
ncbi:hypothetical protein MCEMSE6_02710 [Oxalobacteraceae bacterium]|jgi:hypothetical protein